MTSRAADYVDGPGGGWRRLVSALAEGSRMVLVNRPARLYTTGAEHGFVVLASGGDDPLVVGFTIHAPLTAGFACAIDRRPGGHVSAVVTGSTRPGSALRVGARGILEPAPTASGTRYVARALEWGLGVGRVETVVYTPGGRV